MVFKLYRHETPGHHISDINRRRRTQQNKNVLKMAITMNILLYFSWGFFCIVILLRVEKQISANVLDYLEFWCRFFACLSFTNNFFIYLIFNDIYRDNFNSMISELCCKVSRSRLDIKGIENTGRTNDSPVVGVPLQRLEVTSV